MADPTKKQIEFLIDLIRRLGLQHGEATYIAEQKGWTITDRNGMSELLSFLSDLPKDQVYPLVAAKRGQTSLF